MSDSVSGSVSVSGQAMIRLPALLLCCRLLARGAGAIIRQVACSGALGTVDKAESTLPENFDPQTEADRQAQALIVGGLRHAFPGLCVIGEEEQTDDPVADTCMDDDDDSSRLNDDVPEWPEHLRSAPLEDVCVWVDPVDGTSEFTKGNYEAVTVLIGIAVKSLPAVGVICAPFAERDVWGGPGIGVFDSHRNADSPATSSNRRSGIIVTSKSHLTSDLQQYLDALDPVPKQVCRSGGCGAKILKVLDGEVDAYVYPRDGTKKWDTCAGDAIIRAAGGRLSDKFGAELRYDRSVEPMNCNGLICTGAHSTEFHDEYLVAKPDCQ